MKGGYDMKTYSMYRRVYSLCIAIVVLFVMIFSNVGIIRAEAETGIFRTYDLSETELQKIASLCVHEQPTHKGRAAEASLMANIYDLRGISDKSLYEWVRTCGWWAYSKTYMDEMCASEEDVENIRRVLCDGKRTIPAYVNEHDYIGDIEVVTNYGEAINKRNSSEYIQFVSQIKQLDSHFGGQGITYTYYCHPDTGCDPFGYTSESYRDEKGEAYYDFNTWELINGLPDTPHPQISKTLFSEDEYVEVTWNATPNTTHYWLHTYKDGEDFENTDMYDNLSYSRTYPAGNYTLYIAAYNSLGETHDYVEFTVYDTKPESPHPQIERKFYSANEEINVTWSLTNITTHYWLHTYKDGEDFENTDMYNNLSYSRTYPAGNYTLYIASYNNYGYNADCVEFTVYDSKPQWTKVSVDKTSYSVGETVVFTLSSDTGHAYTIGIDDDKGNRLITYDTEVNQNTPIQSHKQIFDKSGNYSCYITTYNNYGLADSDRIYFTIEPNGDCNDDGEFSVADVILLQKWLLTEEKSIKNWKAADFCEDNQLDVFDLCLMKRKLIND